MNSVPIFSGEISIFDDKDEGLRIECSERHLAPVTRCLTSAALSFGESRVKIAGTPNISNWVELPVNGRDFDRLVVALEACLDTAGVRIVRERLDQPGERHTRLNLANVSVFDKSGQ